MWQHQPTVPGANTLSSVHGEHPTVRCPLHRGSHSQGMSSARTSTQLHMTSMGSLHSTHTSSASRLTITTHKTRTRRGGERGTDLCSKNSEILQVYIRSSLWKLLRESAFSSWITSSLQPQTLPLKCYQTILSFLFLITLALKGGGGGFLVYIFHLFLVVVCFSLLYLEVVICHQSPKETGT